MQNHHSEQELNDFVDAMNRWMPRFLCVMAAAAVVMALYACNKVYGAHVTIAVALLLISFLLIVIGFVVAMNQKPRPDNT